VDVVLPLALPGLLTYGVPDSLVSAIQFGVRVEVPFRKNKRYSALVVGIHDRKPDGYKVKPVIGLLDRAPVLYPEHFRFWQWLSSYYFASLGEVMNAALPAHMKLDSETTLHLSPIFSDDFDHLSDEAFQLAEALRRQEHLTLEDVRKLLNKERVMPLVHKMLDEKIIYLHTELKERYRPKQVSYVRLTGRYRQNQDALNEVFDSLHAAPKQLALLLALMQEVHHDPEVRKADLLRRAAATSASLNALVKKGILEVYHKHESRLDTYTGDRVKVDPLTPAQQKAVQQIERLWPEKDVVLLHGVTGSGKTHIYADQIRKVIAQGGQVLYLLPEIALTGQIVSRLRKFFGEDVTVYHSRLNNNERVEVWKEVLAGKPVVLAARSGVFLPFRRLQLVIVDEAHDRSFKQFDPAPRYNGRDAALVLARIFGAKALLGTATPSMESLHNVETGKYGVVRLEERVGDSQLPDIEVVDLRKNRPAGGRALFSKILLDAIEETLTAGRQVILFQNRRGYAPSLNCTVCGWVSECSHCDVAMTFHKKARVMRCHYCGFAEEPRPACPACGNMPLKMLGFGTEQVEEELKVFFPEAKVGRMDYDTTGGKQGFSRIVHAFDAGEIQILVGTQMVTKGLDFDHVGLVGIMSADQLLAFPDFRSAERAFQQIIQVSGRAGRKKSRGKVLIQTYRPDHPVLKDVLRGDYDAFARRELAERKAFHYPPFTRLVQLTLVHRNATTVDTVAKLMHHRLVRQVSGEVLGPVVPAVARIRNRYHRTILLKLSRRKGILTQALDAIAAFVTSLKTQKGLSSVRVKVDVDVW